MFDQDTRFWLDCFFDGKLTVQSSISRPCNAKCEMHTTTTTTTTTCHMAQSIYLSCLPFPFPFPLPLLLDYWERKGVLVAFSGMLHVPFIDFHFFFSCSFSGLVRSGHWRRVVSCLVLSYLCLQRLSFSFPQARKDQWIN